MGPNALCSSSQKIFLLRPIFLDDSLFLITKAFSASYFVMWQPHNNIVVVVGNFRNFNKDLNIVIVVVVVVVVVSKIAKFQQLLQYDVKTKCLPDDNATIVLQWKNVLCFNSPTLTGNKTMLDCSLDNTTNYTYT